MMINDIIVAYILVMLSIAAITGHFEAILNFLFAKVHF